MCGNKTKYSSIDNGGKKSSLWETWTMQTNMGIVYISLFYFFLLNLAKVLHIQRESLILKKKKVSTSYSLGIKTGVQ